MYVRLASFVLALAVLAPGSRAAAQSTAKSPSQWAVLLGIEDGPGDSALQLRGDLEFPMKPLAPGVAFSIVGQLGFSRFSDSGSYPSYPGYSDSWDSSLNLLKFGGSARFGFGHSAKFHPYAEGGLGVYYAGASFSEKWWDPYYGWQSSDFSDSEVSLFMHLAGGVTFQVSPGFALGVELGFNPYFGDIDETLTSLLASATFRM